MLLTGIIIGAVSLCVTVAILVHAKIFDAMIKRTRESNNSAKMMHSCAKDCAKAASLCNRATSVYLQAAKAFEAGDEVAWKKYLAEFKWCAEQATVLQNGVEVKLEKLGCKKED